MSLDGIVSSLPSPCGLMRTPPGFSSRIFPETLTDPAFLSRRSTLSWPSTQVCEATVTIRKASATKPMKRFMMGRMLLVIQWALSGPPASGRGLGGGVWRSDQNVIGLFPLPASGRGLGGGVQDASRSEDLTPPTPCPRRRGGSKTRTTGAPPRPHHQPLPEAGRG